MPAPLAAAARLGAGEIIAAGAGMGIEDAERRRLRAQMQQDAHEHRVLEDIGEVAGVKGVAIVHGTVALAKWSVAIGEWHTAK